MLILLSSWFWWFEVMGESGRLVAVGGGGGRGLGGLCEEDLNEILRIC